MGILPEAHTSRSSNCDHLKIQILKKKKKNSNSWPISELLIRHSGSDYQQFLHDSNGC